MSPQLRELRSQGDGALASKSRQRPAGPVHQAACCHAAPGRDRDRAGLVAARARCSCVRWLLVCCGALGMFAGRPGTARPVYELFARGRLVSRPTGLLFPAEARGRSPLCAHFGPRTSSTFASTRIPAQRAGQLRGGAPRWLSAFWYDKWCSVTRSLTCTRNADPTGSLRAHVCQTRRYAPEQH